MKRLTIAAACGLLPLLALAGEGQIDPVHQWPQWRGPLGTGEAPYGDPPIEWSEGHNVRWKVELPGLGHSTPVVWGDRVFVTSAVEVGEVLEAPPDRDPGSHDNLKAARRQQFVVLAVDRRDGAVLWRRTVRTEQPHEGTHFTGSWASASPVTDGERLYAYFGSRGLYSLDLDGEVLWEKDFGDMRSLHGHGEGSSPALYGDTLVVNWDHQGQSFVAALDKRTGKQRWKVARDEMTSWSTPLVVEHGGRQQVVISATGRSRAYDLATGDVIWECGGLSRNVVASPVAADGMVFVANSYDWQAMLAIRLADARGDITDSDNGAVVWTLDRLTPYVPSPVLTGGSLCFLRHNQGILTCVEAATGKPAFGPARLPAVGEIFASPVAAAGRLYVAGRSGVTVVLGLGDELELLALNRLEDSFSASPAVAGGDLFLRGERTLYLLAEEVGETAKPQ